METLNADFSRRVVVDTAAADWQASPSPTVWRKRLDLTGAKEASRVTSVVRYDPDSAFHSHPHPDGEEIFVLDGVFSDEHGDYPAGTFLLNPEGFEHAPFSKPGCVLFVKLRQYPGTARQHVTIDTNAASWVDEGAPGVRALTLYAEPGYPETIRLVRLTAGAALPAEVADGGAELFVLDGDLDDGDAQVETGAWIRYPPGGRPALRSLTGVRFYLKTGHLAG